MKNSSLHTRTKERPEFSMLERLIPRDYRIHLVFLAITAIVTIFAYSNVLHGDLQFDDEQHLFEKSRLNDPYSFKDRSLPALFLSGARPVAAFTFSLNYHFWGKDTYSYHLTNLCIHLLNGIMVYIFIYMTLKMPSVRESYAGKAHWVAFFISLIFSIHPIQTQAVSYIVQRYESLASMFYLLSMVLFIIAAKAGPLKKSVCLLLFVATFVLGLGSKQVAVTLPLVALLYGIYFFEKSGLWKKLLVPALMLALGLAFSVYIILASSSGTHAGYNIRDLTVVEYIFTQFRVVFTYLRLIFLPVGQSIDHLYPVNRSFLEIPTLLSFSAIIMLLVGALMSYKRWRAVSFFILWFFIILLPSSSIVPLKDVIVEHRLYLPSMAVYFISASSLFMFFQWMKKRACSKIVLAAFLVAMMSVATLLFAATYHRNSIWNSRLAMWQDVVAKYPDSARGHHNLGNCYLLKKDHKNALKSYLRSMDLAVANMELYYNVGLIFESMGMRGLARDYFAFFVKYSGAAYAGQEQKLIARYGLNDQSTVPNIVDLKKKAVSAFYSLYGKNK
jgi:hypothetical protein